jgi:hypothetical protein
MKINCLVYAPGPLPTVTVPLPNEEGLGGPRTSVDMLEKTNGPARNQTKIFQSFVTCHYTDFVMQSKSNENSLLLGMMSRLIDAEINRSSCEMSALFIRL